MLSEYNINFNRFCISNPWNHWCSTFVPGNPKWVSAVFFLVLAHLPSKVPSPKTSWAATLVSASWSLTTNPWGPWQCCTPTTAALPSASVNGSSAACRPTRPRRFWRSRVEAWWRIQAQRAEISVLHAWGNLSDLLLSHWHFHAKCRPIFPWLPTKLDCPEITLRKAEGCIRDSENLRWFNMYWSVHRMFVFARHPLKRLPFAWRICYLNHGVWSVYASFCVAIYTSRTAQGGGGSFKNRKPIGEVGCCDSRMAERIHWWTERWLISLTFSLSFALFLSLSLSLIIYLPIYLSIYLSTYLSIYPSFHLSIFPSFHLVYPSIYLSIYLSIYPSFHLSIFPSFLSIYLSVCLSVCLSICLSVYLSICLSVYLSIGLSVYRSIGLSVYRFYRSICLSVYLSIDLSACLSIDLSVCLPVCLSTCLSESLKTLLFYETSSFFQVDNIKNAALLRDVLIFWSWQRQKRSKSARPPHFSKLTTSKTKQFCETSSFFKVDDITNEALLRDFFNFSTWQHQKQSNSTRLPSKMESWVQSWQLRTNAFCDFCSPPVESTAPATKKWCQVIRSAAPVTQNHLSKPEDLMLQNATPLRKSAPWPPNISDEHVFCTAPATRNASLQILFKCPTPVIAFGNATKSSRFAHFWQGAQSLAPAMRKHIWTSKSAPYPSVFCTFDFKICSRHNSVHFFDISTSKSGPTLRCFEHFDFKLCFAPQRRALFQHLNFQKWSRAGVFCTFWLRHVLRATTACTFSTSQLPKVVRTWCILYVLTCKCASRHNGAQFFIYHLARWLAALASLLFDPLEPQIIGKTWRNTVFRDFPTFSRICIFFPLTLSLLWFALFYSSLPLPISAFHVSILSEVWLLNFLRL